jgi:hypothetical protein
MKYMFFISKQLSISTQKTCDNWNPFQFLFHKNINTKIGPSNVSFQVTLFISYYGILIYGTIKTDMWVPTFRKLTLPTHSKN